MNELEPILGAAAGGLFLVPRLRPASTQGYGPEPQGYGGQVAWYV